MFEKIKYLIKKIFSVVNVGTLYDDLKITIRIYADAHNIQQSEK